jgi:hypothetical protein
MENTLLLVSEALLLVVALIYSLLTIHILNKRQKQEDPMFFYLLGSGFSLALSSGLCLGALSLL